MGREEFNVRSKLLGKRKAKGKEGFLLKKILEKPFPLTLTSKPVFFYPETAGWLYHNTNVILPIINNKTLKNYLISVENVLLKCWDHREYDDKEKRIQPEPWRRFWVFDSFRFLSYLEDCKIKLDEKLIMTPKQAKTILHHHRWGVPDYEQNLWGASEK